MSKPLNIVIVGGGTSGWMTANLFAKRWHDKPITITLIESHDIPTIGVGEGSTPYIRHFFDALDIPEYVWMPRCCATFKNGITFADWTNKAHYQQYFHPFPSAQDHVHFNTFKQHIMLRRQGADIIVHPDDYFLTAKLTEQARSPIAHTETIESAGHAYHFDAGLLAEFLKEHALSLGVKHIEGKVKKVEVHLNYDIAAVHIADGQRIAGDLFVDCSGFKGLLINEVLKVPFVSFKDNLFNDSAVAIATSAEQSPKLHTLSQAMNCGWRWKIPLTQRTGNGYVYASNYATKEQAETELRAKLGLIDSDTQARHLKMRVGRCDRHWEQNCLAVGLSSGFIEPLEATGLQITQVTIEQFMLQWERGNFSSQYRDFFNQGVNAVFEHIRDYVVLHYLANSRTDTAYWRDTRGDIAISDSLTSLLQAWSRGDDLDMELKRQGIEQYYPSLSWHVLLSGMGVFPASKYTEKGLVANVSASLLSIKQQILESAQHYKFSNTMNQ